MLKDNEDYGAFDTVVTDTLNRHAPLKTKYLRANDGPFMTKALRKAMMHRKDYTINTLRVERTRTIKRIKSKEIFA